MRSVGARMHARRSLFPGCAFNSRTRCGHLSGMSPGSVAGQARRREVAALLLAMLTGGWVAGAQAGEPAVVGAPPAPLTLILKGDREYLDPPAIRTAVESEIGR